MTTAQTTPTQTQAELEETFEFPQDTPPDPAPAVAAQEAPVQSAGIDALLKSTLTIVIQLFPAPADGHAGGRSGVLGVRMDGGQPSIVSFTGDELGPLPARAWELLEAQAIIAAAKKKDAPAKAAAAKPAQAAAPAASKAKPEPAAAKPKATPPVIQRPEPKPAPVVPKADMDDIYSLFDL